MVHIYSMKNDVIISDNINISVISALKTMIHINIYLKNLGNYFQIQSDDTNGDIFYHH